MSIFPLLYPGALPRGYLLSEGLEDLTVVGRLERSRRGIEELTIKPLWDRIGGLLPGIFGRDKRITSFSEDREKKKQLRPEDSQLWALEETPGDLQGAINMKEKSVKVLKSSVEEVEEVVAYKRRHMHILSLISFGT
ncbi:hypothetical protein J5N97_013920 [Dioscorea zingiberensis]|uniref:Uncharacterized protein n=1 Tax=Dioscorea zingiberensis TaxID=325984 RepID=A0A9D5CRP2_9LILI|nr:hypothetical protein J5N97_013920 [Dioscorea zingiberensis]